MSVIVDSPNVKYSEDVIEATYDYHTSEVVKTDTGAIKVRPHVQKLHLRTQRKVPKVGLMLVGLGGNNGTTVTAGILANKLGIKWETKRGLVEPNYFGSLTQSSTVRVGQRGSEEVFVPFNQLVPLVNPNDFEIGGWDCSDANLADAMKRAGVLDIDLQKQLRPLMENIKPLPAIFDIDFVAANQSDRANNVIKGSKTEWVEQVRKDIRDFKARTKVDKIIVLWTANTERWSVVKPGVHDTAANIMAAIAANEPELAPSGLYAVAAILEGCSVINGAPQNTFVPGIIELAQQHGVYVAGDDFKSGQTKMKSALVEFLVGAGIKPECIASYNHLGNNDGFNLASPKQFRSKEISKSNVVDDMVASNQILYPEGKDAPPDHCIVIKYMPFVGDSKRALDEYTASIFMGGQQTIVIHNTCEDSLLASPLILDLAIMCELFERVEIMYDEPNAKYERMNTVLSILSYMLKAPMVPAGTPVVNALNRQRQCLENVIRSLIGLAPENNMLLEYKRAQISH